MFNEVFGLPAHPLIVHGAVVLGPLLCLAAVGYAVLPRYRVQLGWLAAVLAVLAPLTTYAATLSGEELEERVPGARRRYDEPVDPAFEDEPREDLACLLLLEVLGQEHRVPTLRRLTERASHELGVDGVLERGHEHPQRSGLRAPQPARGGVRAGEG